MTAREALEIYRETLKPTKAEARRLKRKVMLALKLIGAIKR